MITPTLWGDPSFNRLSHSARLLTIGMISHADDEGRERGDIGSLRRMVFGFDDVLPEGVTMKFLIGEIREQMGRTIHFYEVNNEEYYHFTNWDRYQKQQKDRIQASEYPKCSKCVAPAKQMLTEVKLSKGKISKDNISRSVGAKAPKAKGKGLIVFEDKKPEEGGKINEMIELFKPVNPTYYRLYPRKQERDAMERLIHKFGEEEVRRMIEILPKLIGKKFAPIITGPASLENKMGALAACVAKEITPEETAFSKKVSFN